jgi:hypothetical protein
MEVREPSRIFAVAPDGLLSEPAYEDYARANERSAACFRSVAFVVTSPSWLHSARGTCFFSSVVF